MWKSPNWSGRTLVLPVKKQSFSIFCYLIQFINIFEKASLGIHISCWWKSNLFQSFFILSNSQTFVKKQVWAQTYLASEEAIRVLFWFVSDSATVFVRLKKISTNTETAMLSSKHVLPVKKQSESQFWWQIKRAGRPSHFCSINDFHFSSELGNGNCINLYEPP